METEYIIKIDTIFPCRICSSMHGVHNILEDELEQEGILLHEALEFVACHKVDPDDSLSKFVCESCLKRLFNAYTFKNLILDTISKETEASSNRNSGIEIVRSDSVESFKLAEDEADGKLSTDAVEFSTKHYSKKRMKIKPLEESVVEKLESRTRSGNGTYDCQFCNKSFRFKSNYIDHIRLHANVKKYICNYCGKDFVQIANYRMHLRIHTNERPFCCPFCEKTFNQSSSLKVHVRTHTQERNYACNVCEKAFKSSSDLCKHKKVHDKNLQFKCELCERYFAQKVNMRRHEQRRHTCK